MIMWMMWPLTIFGMTCAVWNAAFAAHDHNISAIHGWASAAMWAGIHLLEMVKVEIKRVAK